MPSSQPPPVTGRASVGQSGLPTGSFGLVGHLAGSSSGGDVFAVLLGLEDEGVVIGVLDAGVDEGSLVSGELVDGELDVGALGWGVGVVEGADGGFVSGDELDGVASVVVGAGGTVDGLQ